MLSLSAGGAGSSTLRSLLAEASWEELNEVVQETLTIKGTAAAFVLQDCVNVMGQRLGFEVEFGRYRGTQGKSGHDGLWKSKRGWQLVIEVKKTGAYQIDPKTIVSYIDGLQQERKVAANAVGLYVLGSHESDVLEQTIKGAGLAGKLRVISLDGLVHLSELVETRGLSHDQVVSLLAPLDNVFVDSLLGIIDELIQKEETVEEDREEEDRPYAPTPRNEVDATFSQVSKVIEARLKRPLKVLSRKMREWDGSRAVLFFSKDYGGGRFWFGFHSNQLEYLKDASTGLAIFVCAKADQTIVWPFEDFREKLSSLNVTVQPKRTYWHVQIFAENVNGATRWVTKGKGGTVTEVTSYLNNWEPLR